MSSQPLILASASPSRQNMLRNAGVEFEAIAADLDEQAMIASLTGPPEPLSPDDVASLLATAKAQTISETAAGRFVIGSDQTMSLGKTLFTKPSDMSEARRMLLALSGRTHNLHSAVTLVRNGEVLWSHVESVAMTMREIGPEFIGRYLARAGEDVLSSVGVYQLEGLGAQLFEKIDGDFFCVLGLPLLPLLGQLRQHKLMDA